MVFFIVPVQAETISLAPQLPALVVVQQTPESPPADNPSVIDGILGMFDKIDAKMLYIYSFEDKQSALGALAAYPLVEVNNDITLNAEAVLISNDGLSMGLGVGASIKNVISVFDVMGGWTPQNGAFLGIGINKLL
jgi:hypothetical protein